MGNSSLEETLQSGQNQLTSRKPMSAVLIPSSSAVRNVPLQHGISSIRATSRTVLPSLADRLLAIWASVPNVQGSCFHPISLTRCARTERWDRSSSMVTGPADIPGVVRWWQEAGRHPIHSVRRPLT